MQSIRVAMIIQYYLPYGSGAERQLARLAPFLQERSIEMHVITRRYPGLKAYEEIDNVPVHRLPSIGPKALKSIMFSASAIPTLSRIRPDILHAYNLYSPTMTAILAKSLLKTPVVVKILRGGELGDLWTINQRRFGHIRLNWYRRYVDRFISISQEIDDELEANHIPIEQQARIPNGVDVEHFKPVSEETRTELRQEFNIPPDATVAIFVGRLSPEKRVKYLIDIWSEIREQYPQAFLLIVGYGVMEEELKAQAGDGIMFTGRVKDAAPYLKASDIYVLPSATEGLSNSMLEGMAVGLSPIVTNVGGAPDLIRNGETGYLIPPDDIEALQTAISHLIEKIEHRQEIGHAARNLICEDYSLDKTADKLRMLYQTLL